jgi:hypothetical protein
VTLHSEGYETRRQDIAGWPVNIVSYKIGDVFHCVIDNVDPGARVARGEGASRAQAEQQAIEAAQRRLERMRRFAP